MKDELKKQLILDLQNKSVKISEVDFKKCGYNLEVSLTSQQVRDFVTTLYNKKFYLVFVTAVHVTPLIEVVYQFAYFEGSFRINIRVPVTLEGTIPTISDIFQGADWHERETRDFLGVVFSGHPNLKTLILAEEDVDLKPLLKNEKVLKASEKVFNRDQIKEEKKTGEKKAKADKVKAESVS
ncbi:MAG: NADH-quinone oxidoreductase subunit C [Desulfobacterales bacterium]|nr:NADH-quinone oxidoreductase subunit C [Desulfobacterales bacterium]